MEIKKVSEISGERLRVLRTARGERLEDFWGAVGYSTSRGHAYETGATSLPEHVRRLVFLHYVVGIPTNLEGAEFNDLVQAIEAGSIGKIRQASTLLEQGQQLLNETLSVLNGEPIMEKTDDDDLLPEVRDWIAGQEDGTTLATVAKQFGVTKPIARRICNQLADEGLLERPARGSERYTRG